MDLKDRQFVILGGPELLECIEEAAENGQHLSWTIDHKAKVGEGVLFYLLRPVMAFVAHGIVKTKPVAKSDINHPDHYWSDIESIEMLPSHIKREELLSKIPAFKYIKMPISSYLIPESIASEIGIIIKRDEEESENDLWVGDRVEYRTKGSETAAEGVVTEIDVEEEVVKIKVDGRRELEVVPFDDLVAIIDDS